MKTALFLTYENGVSTKILQNWKRKLFPFSKLELNLLWLPFWLLHQDSLNENHRFPLECSEFSSWVPLIRQKLPFILNILVPKHYLLRWQKFSHTTYSRALPFVPQYKLISMGRFHGGQSWREAFSFRMTSSQWSAEWMRTGRKGSWEIKWASSPSCS